MKHTRRLLNVVVSILTHKNEKKRDLQQMVVELQRDAALENMGTFIHAKPRDLMEEAHTQRVVTRWS